MLNTLVVWSNSWPKEIQNKKIALIKNFALIEIIKYSYPNIQIIDYTLKNYKVNKNKMLTNIKKYFFIIKKHLLKSQLLKSAFIIIYLFNFPLCSRIKKQG